MLRKLYVFGLLLLSGLGLSADEATAAIETSEQTPTYEGAFMKMMLTLGALLILIMISVWMLRKISHARIKQMNMGRGIKILERRPLSAKTALYIIQVGEKKMLVAESQLEVRTLANVEEPLSE